jgi:hypothetical protein
MEKTGPKNKEIDAQIKKYFREVDKENIGVITHVEYLSLIKNVGVKLTAQ